MSFSTNAFATSATILADGPVAFIPTPSYPVWSVAASNQAPNSVFGISGPPGWQAPPPPGDPRVVALQSAAVKSGLI